MYQVAAALKTFFSGFDLPAYTEDTIPDDAQLPYITYPASIPEWNQKASMYAQVWYRTTTNTPVVRKADQITAAIGEGLRIALPDGYLVIWPESPLVQILVDEDTRRAYINLSINAYILPGQ